MVCIGSLLYCQDSLLQKDFHPLIIIKGWKRGSYSQLSTKYINSLYEVKSLSHVRLFATPWTVANQAPPSMGFSRQEYWNGLPFPSPGDLPHPGIQPGSPALQADALLPEPPGKSLNLCLVYSFFSENQVYLQRQLLFFIIGLDIFLFAPLDLYSTLLHLLFVLECRPVWIVSVGCGGVLARGRREK